MFLPAELRGAGHSFDMNQTQSSHGGANIRLRNRSANLPSDSRHGEAMAQTGRTTLMAKSSTATQQDSLQTHAKYERLIARAKGVEAPKTLVVHPCDETSLRGALEAAAAGLIVPILVGPAAKISTVARTHKLDLDGIEIVDVAHSDAAAEKAVELVQAGMGEILMKGSLHTDELMRAVTNSKTGLRTARRISHVFVLDVP